MTCWIVDVPGRPCRLQVVLSLREINGKILIIASKAVHGSITTDE
jgi:hypothetical protein